MRMLFEIDKKNYKNNGSVFNRPSVRGIIMRDGRFAMIYSKKYNYYQFPGGGIKAGESMEDALIREVSEEAGLCVIRNSIQEYGQVHRVQKGTKEDIFMQDIYYFLCDVKETVAQQKLEQYEAEEGFTLQFPEPQLVINTNRAKHISDVHRQTFCEQEARVLELLLQERFSENI